MPSASPRTRRQPSFPPASSPISLPALLLLALLPLAHAQETTLASTSSSVRTTSSTTTTTTSTNTDPSPLTTIDPALPPPDPLFITLPSSSIALLFGSRTSAPEETTFPFPTRTLTVNQTMTTAVAPLTPSPSVLAAVAAIEYTVFGGMPFKDFVSLGYQNNYLIGLGPTFPNYNNETNSTDATPASSEVWMSAYNNTGLWTYAWSPPLGSDPNITGTAPTNSAYRLSTNTTLNTTYYTALNVKHSKLQIDTNQMYLVSSSGSVDVLNYWYQSPRRTYARDYPPRSIAFPPNVTAIDRITSLDNSFGVFAASNNTVYYLPVTDLYSPNFTPPTTDAGAANFTLTSSYRGAVKVGVFQGTLGAMWLTQDFASLYLVEHIPANRTVVWRWPVSGPTARIGVVDPSNYTGSPYISEGRVLLELNRTTWPPAPDNLDAWAYAKGPVSSLVVDPRRGDLYVGLEHNWTVLVYGNAGRFDSGRAVLKGKVELPFPYVRAMEMDNDGTVLFVAGSDGRSGKVATLELAKTPYRSAAVATAGAWGWAFAMAVVIGLAFMG
ncbi:hypothetical protein HDU96_009285 [Phlyctochytrium bullatum]|nr:hypothetical protein HDU96_009285 [Phlyctochytrium bullatum]